MPEVVMRKERHWLPAQFIEDIVVVYFAKDYQYSSLECAGMQNIFLINSHEVEDAVVPLRVWTWRPEVCCRALYLSPHLRT